jgi:carotenoid 1,2-hydratase
MREPEALPLSAGQPHATVASPALGAATAGNSTRQSFVGEQAGDAARNSSAQATGARYGEPPGFETIDDAGLAAGPRFDRSVGPDGYVWWYVDAFSEDRAYGITLIAFIGSVFSPYYATARRNGPADPRDHCALNVALYGRGGKRWAMTERRRGRLQQSATSLTIGPSSLSWDGRCLRIALDEQTAVFPRRLRGEVRVYPEAIGTRTYGLDLAARHRWWPIAPRAAVEVSLPQPGLAWRGLGYLDCNHGDAPLERDFVAWDWSRTMKHSGATVFYDVTRRGGERAGLALDFGADGRGVPAPAPPETSLRRTLWGLPRRTRTDPGSRARVVKTLEDGPFYARSVIDSQLQGERVSAVHESLCLDRFSARWVQGLLPYRMPRDPG